MLHAVNLQGFLPAVTVTDVDISVLVAVVKEVFIVTVVVGTELVISALKVLVFLGTVDVVENIDVEDVGTAVDSVVDVTWDVSVGVVVLTKVVIVVRAGNVSASEVVVSCVELVLEAVLVSFVAVKVEVMSEVLVI
jgi:hypothetical protein